MESKKLTSPQTFDTDLERRGEGVLVTIQPSKDGGNLIFRQGLKRKVVPLNQILSNVLEQRPDGVCAADWVELGALEPRIMIYADDPGGGVEEFDPEHDHRAKEILFHIVRELRNERREERGLPPVVWSGVA